MRKFLLCVLTFFFNVAVTYALSFDVNLSSNKISLNSGDNATIDFSLVNISDTDAGISSCLFDIVPDNGIIIADTVNVFDDWRYEKGNKGYMLYTTSSVKNNYKLLSISATINSSGNVTFSNITCYDENDNEKNIGDKAIRFVVANNSNNSVSSSENSNTSKSISSKSSSSKSSSSKSSSSKSSSLSSNPSLESKLSSNSSASSNSSIIDSPSHNITEEYILGFNVVGGEINFDKTKYDYKIYVDDLNALKIEPVVATNYSYDVEKLASRSEAKYIFSVYDSNSNTKTYTIVASLVGATNNLSSGNYTYIFIIIIVLLLGINILRIAKRKKI